MTKSPYVKEQQALFVSGGYNIDTQPKKVEVLTQVGWETVLEALPEAVRLHCMVLLNSTTVMVIGGIQVKTLHIIL